MRNLFFATSVLAIIMSACSNDELMENTETSSVIGFAPLSSNVLTRATAIDNSNLKDNPFEVYAFTKDGNCFMGEKSEKGVNISFSDGKWNYTNPADMAYWPKQELDFFAFYPARALNDHKFQMFSYNVESSESQIITYAIPGNVSDQVDLMYAIARDVKKGTNNGTAKLKFRHALSQVYFNARTEFESMSVDIEKIVLHNHGDRGRLTLPTSGDAITSKNWEIRTITPNGWIQFAVDAEKTNIQTAKTRITSESEVTMFIPQELNNPWKPSLNGGGKTNADKNLETYLCINCKIRQNGVYLHGSDNKYAPLYIPFSAKWEPGKRYGYTLIFGGGYTDKGESILSPIQFDVEAEDWADDKTNDVEVKN